MSSFSAARFTITNISKIIMRHHMEHYIVDAVQNDELEHMEDLKSDRAIYQVVIEQPPYQVVLQQRRKRQAL
jgi:DNA-binding FrmR family transcriptional regulator